MILTSLIFLILDYYWYMTTKSWNNQALVANCYKWKHWKLLIVSILVKPYFQIFYITFKKCVCVFCLSDIQNNVPWGHFALVWECGVLTAILQACLRLDSKGNRSRWSRKWTGVELFHCATTHRVSPTYLAYYQPYSWRFRIMCEPKYIDAYHRWYFYARYPTNLIVVM